MMGKKLRYIIVNPQTYYSERYDKYVSVPAGFPSDGATGAVDISGLVEAWDTWEYGNKVLVSLSWVIHDQLCNKGVFDDGTKCTNKQASTILSDILRSEGRWLRAVYWWPMTFLFGGGKCRKNKC